MRTLNLILVVWLAFAFQQCLLSQHKGDAATTELWEPVPPVVTPGTNGLPPSDAIILFDGKNLSQWIGENGKDPGWEVRDGAVNVVKGTGKIQTKKSFGDCQLHIEFRTPEKVEGTGQGRGNSGVYLQDLYEIQVLDCYQNTTYVNGQTGAVYKQSIPLVNACRKPGEWQSYDIIYMAPRFSENGRLAIPGRVTVLHNGVLIQNNIEIWGTTENVGSPEYKVHGKKPLSLQDHGNPVSYRNIWIREL